MQPTHSTRSASVIEIRHYHQNKALAEIEPISN
jgi:hypothetical protein